MSARPCLHAAAATLPTRNHQEENVTTTEKTKTSQSTYGGPEFKPGQPHDPEFCDTDCVECLAAVGWDLSFGSRINFGPDADDNLTVSLHLSDDALANSMVYRKVTDVQVIAFARYLLALTKGDDDIETIAVKLAETAAQFNQRIEEKAEELAAPRVAEARRQVAEVMVELERVGEFHQQRLDDLRAEQARQVSALEQQIERLIAAAKTEGSR